MNTSSIEFKKGDIRARVFSVISRVLNLNIFSEEDKLESLGANAFDRLIIGIGLEKEFSTKEFSIFVPDEVMNSDCLTVGHLVAFFHRMLLGEPVDSDVVFNMVDLFLRGKQEVLYFYA